MSVPIACNIHNLYTFVVLPKSQEANGGQAQSSRSKGSEYYNMPVKGSISHVASNCAVLAMHGITCSIITKFVSYRGLMFVLTFEV